MAIRKKAYKWGSIAKVVSALFEQDDMGQLESFYPRQKLVNGVFKYFPCVTLSTEAWKELRDEICPGDIEEKLSSGGRLVYRTFTMDDVIYECTTVVDNYREEQRDEQTEEEYWRDHFEDLERRTREELDS